MKTDAIAYSPVWRIAAAVLMVTSRGSLLVLLVLVVFFDTRLSNQLRLMRAFAGLCLAPEIAIWILARTFAVTASIESGGLVLRRREQRIEIPADAIDGVVPWVVPLPSGGFWLRLKSGRRFRYGLQVVDPVAFIDALADAAAPEHVRAAARHPTAIYTRWKNSVRRWWDHPLLKFVVFALVPTLPLFRLHQWVAYGGTFGEYYTYGLQAYLLAFAIYWATDTIYLVLYAAALRAAAETVAFAAAWLAPFRAGKVRRAVEIADRVLYFGAVPLVLLRMFLLS